MKQGFLRCQSSKIVDENGKSVHLKGVNVGGWLMMEAYFMGSPNIGEQFFKKTFQEHLGAQALKDFEEAFRTTFICEKDIQTIASWGMNCIRVPFNCRLLETQAFQYNDQGFEYLDNSIAWAKKAGVWLILDLHAAPGAQSHDWHCDSTGKAELWLDEKYRKRTYALWERIAERYATEPTVVGYDVLNEAVMDDPGLLNEFYKNIIKSIRKFDTQHILFIEGNTWATDLECLDQFEDDNYALSIHSYAPIEFTCHFEPYLKYPLNTKKHQWNLETTKKHLSQYTRVARKHGVPLHCGEFGVNNRQGLYGEGQWLDEILACFEESEIHWTYWTYKAVKHHIFPDGIYTYPDNPLWVNRPGPVTGWDTYHLYWEKYKKEMIEFFKTGSFVVNQEILKVLKKYA